jgi:hypothetical protein
VIANLFMLCLPLVCVARLSTHTLLDASTQS